MAEPMRELFRATIQEALEPGGVGGGGTGEESIEALYEASLKVANYLLRPDKVWVLRSLVATVPAPEPPGKIASQKDTEWHPCGEPEGKKSLLFSTVKHVYWGVRFNTLAIQVVYRATKETISKWEILKRPGPGLG